jgi:hypothetical protein
MNLLEIISLKHNTELFLSKWTEGSSRAIAYLSTLVKHDLKKTVTEDSYKVYRGWKFNDEDLVADLFGTNHPNLKSGTKVKVKLESPHSWTKDKAEAVKFANPRYDSLNKHWVDDEELEDLGYEAGDLLGIGILVSATILKDAVIADLDNVNSDILSYDDKEHEIISDKGEFLVEIIDVTVYNHDKSTNSDFNDWTEEEWIKHNRESR